MTSGSVENAVRAAMQRARAAQAQAARWDQATVDDVVAAVGWVCYRTDTARRIADRSHAETGLGDAQHLYELQRARVLGLLHDLHGAVTVGVVEDDPRSGIRKIARPIGVVAVASPATAPGSGVMCNALTMLKTRNAVIFTPNPRAHGVAMESVNLMRDALLRLGAPPDLIQCLDVTGREAAEALMAAADLVVAVGGSGAVRRAYSSGTPAFGAGVGNPTVVVDESADLAYAAERILFGASYNNGTSCSSESNVLVDRTVIHEFAAQLERAGGHLCTASEGDRLATALWPDGRNLNRQLIGRPVRQLAEAAGIAVDPAREVTTLVVAHPSPHVDSAIMHEKLAPVLTMSAYDSFDQAAQLVRRILDNYGRGHSCGLYSSSAVRAEQLANTADTCRVVWNQSTMTNSGSLGSGVPYTQVISSGSWGGCSVSGNVTWRDFLNYTVVSRPIPERVPDRELLFGRHFRTDVVLPRPVSDSAMTA
ncbi:aldehyde dehydrogenase family protein [Nocardia sp. NPDC020380]|uniref:aldehyde dehydrogenase family protein n=1 Tax=Nocardia sp. NPDC020380 TaxID=3364309 RepID=UPI00379AFB51